MNSFCKKTLFSLLVLSIFFVKLKAQYISNLSKYEIGVQVGGLVSRTALTPYSSLGAYKQMQPFLAIFGQVPLYKLFSVRAGLTFGQIGSDDSKVSDKKYLFLKLRNFKYTTTMAELSTVIVWNLAQEKYNLFTQEHSNRFTPYVFGGIGFSYVHVQRDWSGFDATYFAATAIPTFLGIDTTVKLPHIATVFPVGGGLRYAVNPQIALFSEINFRYNFEHYLDGFNFSTGRPNSKDFFYGISVGVSYRPYSNDYRNNCPKMVL